jgi:hypothetical protein
MNNEQKSIIKNNMYTLTYAVELNPGPETYISSSPPNLDNSSNDNSISLCNINIRSIRNKTNFVQHFADEFDILVITESHRI